MSFTGYPKKGPITRAVKTFSDRLAEIADIKKSIEALGGGVEFRGALVYRTTNQSIPDSTWTAIQFDNEDYDTDNIHDNTANNTRLVVPARVTSIVLKANARFAASSTKVSCRILKNGTTVMPGRVDSQGGSTFNNSALIITPRLVVSEGDYFEFQVYQYSGAALDVLGGYSQCWFAMEIIE